MRYLAPSEIELWELARRAGLDEAWFTEPVMRRMFTKAGWNDAAVELNPPFIVGASPQRIVALLETLEKTREAALRMVEQHDAETHGPRGVCIDDTVNLARALLAGFKEESSG